MKIDFIGDVHAHIDKLKELLGHLGYVHREWTWRHPDPDRSACFIGDIINRGPCQVETYVIVRSMVEAGSATCILGNHEFDAIAMSTPHPKTGWPMLDSSDRNLWRFHEFHRQVGEGSKLHGEIVRWFKTLPLWIETDAYRAVHACWHPASAAALASLVPDGHVRQDAWNVILDIETEVGRAADMLVRGPHVPSRNPAFPPVRLRWWMQDAATVRLAAVPAADVDRETGLLPFDAAPYRDDGKPLFFGHYGVEGRHEIVGRNAACVDHYAGERRELVAYAWRGENVLTAEGFEFAARSAPAMAARM
jgi:hypothetical protein